MGEKKKEKVRHLYGGPWVRSQRKGATRTRDGRGLDQLAGCLPRNLQLELGRHPQGGA